MILSEFEPPGEIHSIKHYKSFGYARSNYEPVLP